MRLIRVLLCVCLGNLLPEMLHAAAPEPPQNVQPAWIYGGPVNCARLTWDAVEGADSYNVYRFNDSTANWDPIAVGTTNLMNFDFEAAPVPKSYVVTAVNSDGESSASGIATVIDGDVYYFLHRSPSEFPEPDQRYGWVLPTSARIIWLLQYTGGADGMLEFGDSVTNLQTVYFQPDYQMFGHGVTLTNLTPSTPYYYRITSVTPNRVGYSTIHFLQTPEANHPPVATPQSLSLFEDTPLSITLSGDDVDGDALSYTITAGPSNGTLTGTPPNLTYVPSTNFFGSDSLSFTVNDGTTNSAEATVTLQVIPVNDAPITTDRTVTLDEDSFVEIPNIVFDADGDVVTFISVQPPAHGFVTSFGTSLYYIADPDFSGTDSFSFQFSDWSSASSMATVTAIVTPVNDAPTATNQLVEIDEDTAVTVPAFAGDIDGDPLTFVIAIQPQHGTATVSGSNFVYTPNLNFNGVDYFAYYPVDGSTTGTIAAVQFYIWPVNDAPDTTNRFLVTAEDTPVDTWINLYSDPDLDPVSIVIVDGPAHGTLDQLQSRYTPNPNFVGTDSFTFKYNDGLVDGNLATVTINVTPVNDPPVATNRSLTMLEDGQISFSMGGTDVDGDPLSVIILSGPSSAAVFGWNGVGWTYRPRLNFYGTDTITFMVNDGQAYSLPATVTITVTPVNDAPTANPRTVFGSEDTSATILLTGSDPEGSALTFSISIAPTNGTLSGTPPNVVYTPFANVSGDDHFSFRVYDGELYSAAMPVHIFLAAWPDAPVANSQSVTTPYNTPVAITLSGSDADGDALSYTILSATTNGVLSGSAPNLTFTPNIGWSGTNAFAFRVSDGTSNSSPATVTITVQAATTLPAAPGGLTATPVSSSQINLTWADNSGLNEDGFKIERSATANSWTQIAIVGQNATSYSNTGLAANKNYSYRVRAYNALGNSPYSGTASAKTLH